MTSSVRCLFTNFSPRNLGDCLMVDAAIHGVIAINQAATILLPQNTHDIDFHINSGQVKRLRIPDYRNFANQPRRAKLGSLMSGPFQDFRFWKRENVDLIFDISGFYIGGGHDSQRARNIINHYRKGVESGAKLIVLPKTFGPLSNNSDKDLVAELFDLSSIFFCRDQKSLETVSKIIGTTKSKRIQLGFDYTASVPSDAGSSQHPKQAAAIIPNVRMLDRTNPLVAESFFPFMAEAIKVLGLKGLTPVIVLQQPDIDMRAAEEIRKLVGGDIEIFSSFDHRKVKGFIYDCDIVLSARFHGILNAISSGVPVLGLGWNHKYEEMLKSLNLDRFFVDGARMTQIKGDQEQISKLIDDAMNAQADFTSARARHAELTSELWDKISPLVNPA